MAANALQSKVAIITGAAQGIGFAIAERYALEGANVVIADLSADAAELACARINKNVGRPDSAIPVVVDVTEEIAVDRLIDVTLKRYGQIDVLVNNAGLWKTVTRQPFWDVSVEEWERVFAVNSRGPFLCSAAAAGPMIERRQGKIILIGSATVWTAQSTLTPYASSKAALIGLLRCMARELGPHGICVNMIHPGLTDTGDTSREYLEVRSKNRLIPRVQMPADLIGAATFFASDDSSFITGQQLHVDGGLILV